MITSWKILVFIIFTLFNIFISRRSLVKPRSHGFPRFFAFEVTAAIILLNVNYWFRDPFAWNQVISWTLLILSIIPLIFGVSSLISKGKPIQKRNGEPQLLAFEKTSLLVMTGIYRYIRHPMYSSLLIFVYGVLFKNPAPLQITLSFVITILLFFTAKADEAECISYFGDDYLYYMEKTKRFIPFLI